jgi:hypothetical protein
MSLLLLFCLVWLRLLLKTINVFCIFVIVNLFYFCSHISLIKNQGDFISIDQVSVFGTEQNIRNTVTKRSIDDKGIHKFYEHSSTPKRNAKEQLDLYDTTVTETLEELHQNGVDAVSLTPETFATALKDNKIVFVDFYAKYVHKTPHIFVLLLIKALLIYFQAKTKERS